MASFESKVIYALTVPTHRNDGTTVSDGYHNFVAGILADEFGGASLAAPGRGLWLEGVHPQTEGHVVIYSIAEATPDNDAFVLDFAATVALVLDQECILVTKTPCFAAFVAPPVQG
jgi:hypothetical protein